MRLAVLGTPEFAASALAALIASGHDIAAVYSQPPRPAGRGQKLEPSAVHRLAERHGLPVRTPKTLRNPDEQAAFAALGLDCAVVAAYGLILPPPILAAPRLGCLNIHASLLPRWRGAAPIQRAILAGDAETGITLMVMDAGLDTGPMLRAEAVPIGPGTTGGALHDTLAVLGARLIVEALADPAAWRPQPQPAEGATYAAKVDKAELALPWTEPAAAVERRIRAFAPKPGAYALIGGERVKLLAAELVAGAGPPGRVLDDDLAIACADGAIRPTRLQRPGRGPVDRRAFLNGFPVAAGTLLADALQADPGV